MGFADLYLARQKGFRPHFPESPPYDLGYIVVIPSFLEPDLITTLKSLSGCIRPGQSVEVIVVFNLPSDAGEDKVAQSRRTAETTSAWVRAHSSPGIRFLLTDILVIPPKDAGVGYARKFGMDQAVFRFNTLGHTGGMILSLDADCRCDADYFTAIGKTLENHPSTNGFNLYFEHPVSGDEYPEPVYRGITGYELHLRCMNLFLRSTGFPYAYHTIGSCFGVRADAYVRQGGMNRRKAGEDFYFLHKIIPLGHFREINGTRVVPSPRESFRVPFGTGAAIGKYLSSGEQEVMTYPPDCYHDLRQLFREAGSLYRATREEIADMIGRQSPVLRDFLEDNGAREAIRMMQENAGSAMTFVKRFFGWFDAFRVIKFLNHSCRTRYRRIPAKQAALIYLGEAGYPLTGSPYSDTTLLGIIRGIEKARV